MGLKLFQKHHVLRQAAGCLAGRTHHKARTHLVADFPQIVKAAFARIQAHPRRMKGGIVRVIRRFVPKQIAGGARIEQALVRFARAFAQGKGDGAIGVALVNGGDYARHAIIGEERVFPALEHKGTEAQLVALFAACQDLFLAEPIAVCASIASPYAAVEAVVLAVVGELDEPAGEDVFAVALVGHGARTPRKVRCKLWGAAFYQLHPFRKGKALLLLQLFHQLIWVGLRQRGSFHVAPMVRYRTPPLNPPRKPDRHRAG